LNLPALNVRLHSSHSTKVSRGLDGTHSLYTGLDARLTAGAQPTCFGA
jgi:hypothetical protein